jgi:hypothetical protein
VALATKANRKDKGAIMSKYESMPLTWTDIQAYVRACDDDDIVHLVGERNNSILARAYYHKEKLPCSMLVTHQAGTVSIEMETYEIPPRIWKIHELCEKMPQKTISKKEYVAWMNAHW